MHLDLSTFKVSEKAAKKINVLKEAGITFEFYDSAKHTGLDKLFDDLQNEYWRKDIKDNLALAHPRPILVASDRGSVCGFVGPIAVQQSGRGWFAGIGVDPAYEGKGIGSILFILLMENFKKLGAGFSTLYTGIENHAQKIYERAGFKVVKQWAIMRKKMS